MDEGLRTKYEENRQRRKWTKDNWMLTRIRTSIRASRGQENEDRRMSKPQREIDIFRGNVSYGAPNYGAKIAPYVKVTP
jgi:hypothetical protein